MAGKAGKSIGIYRLPMATSTRVGDVKIVFDRHKQAYLAGSKVVGIERSGDFLVLTAADGKSYYVKEQEFIQLQEAPRK